MSTELERCRVPEAERRVVIRHKLGLHARPATEIARMSANFSSALELTRPKDGAAADCRSVLGMLVLAAGDGTELRLSGRGEDAEAAVEKIAEFFASGFGEK